jgi:hypothetical protein
VHLSTNPFSHLALIVALTIIGAAFPPVAAACEPPRSTRSGLVPLATFGIERPLYVMRENGRLDRGDLRSGTWQKVLHHELNWAPHVEVSGDGRWVSIHGVTRDGSATQYWLYDLMREEEHELYQHPAWGGSIPSFSPDSRRVLLLALRDQRWPSMEAEGLFLHELASRRLERLPLPEGGAKSLENGHVMADWAIDGKSLLMVFREYRAKGETSLETAYEYSLETRHYRPISARFDDTLHRHRFFADGKELEAHEAAPLASHAGYTQRHSRNGKWNATITGEHELRVSEEGGRSHAVDIGLYDHCEGVTIRIHGWIDDERLVYESGHSTYVYSAADRSRALLFDEEEGVATFFW